MKTSVTTHAGTTFVSLSSDIYIGKSLQQYGEWSYGEIDVLRHVVPPHASIVEAGANVGAHTVFLARDLCPAGAIYSFEPRRLLFQILCANLALNRIENVFAFQMAAGSRRDALFEGPMETERHVNAGGFSLGAIPGASEKIAIAPLDDMLSDFKRIDLIKADIEGHELELLIGARHLLQRDRPILYLENDRRDLSPKLLNHVFGLDYEIWSHVVPLFRPDNRAHNPTNMFGALASHNILCVPRENAVLIDRVGALSAQNPRLTRCARS